MQKRIQKNEMQKYVITGPSGSGKSSLIAAFEKRGFYALHEVAEPYILEQQKLGIAEPWKSPDFQPKLLELQVSNELSLRGIPENHTMPKNHTMAFMDRAIPDALAYFEYRKQKVPDKFIDNIAQLTKQYSKVFFLEPSVSFDPDGFRVEKNYDEANTIGNLVESSYRKLGYTPIHVPVFNSENKEEGIEKRIKFILERVKFILEKN